MQNVRNKSNPQEAVKKQLDNIYIYKIEMFVFEVVY
jgi:hypothetical protein